MWPYTVKVPGVAAPAAITKPLASDYLLLMPITTEWGGNTVEHGAPLAAGPMAKSRTRRKHAYVTCMSLYYK